MKNCCAALILSLLFTCFAVFSLNAQTLKIGSVAPAGSPWDETLKEMAAEWKELSNGRINVRIYPGGIAGDEDAMLRKMRVGQLDGVVLTSIGLNIISPDLFIMSLPRLIRNIEEYDYIVPRIESTYDALMKEKGYKLITWTMAGWINFFTTTPVATPQDLKQLRIGIIPGQEGMERIWQQLGYRVLPITSIDWLSSLQGGMISATFTSPLAAAAFQVFGPARYMLDFPVSPLLGALVISDRSWSRIPSNLREPMIARAKEIIRPLYTQATELEAEAIEIMLENGLVIHKPSEREFSLWEAEMERAYSFGLGEQFSGEIFREITDYLEEYRSR
jgi:TRAP-type transport system periplasmic protein